MILGRWASLTLSHPTHAITGRNELKKSLSPSIQLNSVNEFFESLKESRLGPEAISVIESVVHWAQECGFNLRLTKTGIFLGEKNAQGDLVEPFAFGIHGDVTAQLLHTKYPFNAPDLKEEIRKRLATIPGIDLKQHPYFPCSTLDSLSTGSVLGFQKLLIWVRQEIEHSH